MAHLEPEALLQPRVLRPAAAHRLTALLHWSVKPAGCHIWLPAVNHDILSAECMSSALGLAPESLTSATDDQTPPAKERRVKQRHTYHGHQAGFPCCSLQGS